jgi:ABC-type transport system substrate-binding protein
MSMVTLNTKRDGTNSTIKGEPMRMHTQSGRRPGVLLISAMASLALIAGACSSKKDEGDVAAVDVTEAAGPATTAGADTPVVTEAQDTEVTEAEVVETDPPATEVAASDPVPGGTLIVSGEAEVAQPWTPAAMQCDSYCQQRARTFYDPIAAVGADNKVHPYLAETITPNADFTEWTVKLRSGIKFTDGTDLNADAIIDNLQRVGKSLLISKALVDLAKVASADGTSPCVNPDRSDCVIKVEKVDELTATIYTGKDGDPAKPIPWPGFDYYMTGQGGLIASPTWPVM